MILLPLSMQDALGSARGRGRETVKRRGKGTGDGVSGGKGKWKGKGKGNGKQWEREQETVRMGKGNEMKGKWTIQERRSLLLCVCHKKPDICIFTADVNLSLNGNGCSQQVFCMQA